MRFGLGTANFGIKYGVLDNKISLSNIKKLLNDTKNINLIDTAQSYPGVEKIIGEHNRHKKKIITKIVPFSEKKIKKNIKNFKHQFQDSLQDLKKKSVYGLLFHNEKDILRDDISTFLEYLKDLQDKKKIFKIGISLYNIYDLEKYLKIYKFDIVQFPINIFTINTKLINYLKSIKKRGIEIHARSIFLQGMLFEKKFSRKFNELKLKKNKLEIYLAKKKLKKYNYLISVLYDIKFIDYCIIGFRNKENINDFSKFKKVVTNLNYVKKLEIKNKNIIDPRKW